MAEKTSYATDIRPLFTDRDVHGMSKAFNLASYDDVKAHAAAIYDRIRGIGGGVMPPPPPRGEGQWPQSRIELFAKWMADGYQPQEFLSEGGVRGGKAQESASQAPGKSLSSIGPPRLQNRNFMAKSHLLHPCCFLCNQTYGRCNRMSIVQSSARLERRVKQVFAFVLSFALLFATWPQSLSAVQSPPPPPPVAPAAGTQAPPYAQQTPEQLQQLVAPIALYPDSLVAQILAASSFPEQIVEADRWVQDHADLKGAALGQAVDQQPWDPSVKALTAFPSVLGNMDKNISWTSSLGDAYYNQQQDVMNAVQVMREKAEQAGNLKTTPQENVTTDEYGDIDVAPANPEVVYVPAYDPWLAYGYSISPWPGWYEYPGIWFGGPYLSFGAGFGIGWFGGFGWGWPRWGFDWHNHYAVFNHNRYYSESRTFYNRGAFYRNGGARGNFGAAAAQRGLAGGSRGSSGMFNSPRTAARPFEGSRPAARGYAAPRGESGTRSGAFSNYDHGGESRSYSSRGSSSFGGGGSHGGGFSGGGGHGGGGHR